MKDATGAIERASLPAILKAGRRIGQLHAQLQALIEAHPECFVKPRTLVVDGLKFGLQKQKGKLCWDDDDQLCQRIGKLAESGAISAGQAAQLVTVKTRPVPAALKQLDARLLKKLGVAVTDDTDAPLIKTVDGEVEKLVRQITRQTAENADNA